MGQVILLIIGLLVAKLVWDAYKEQSSKKSPRSKEKGGQVIDLSNAWIELDDMPYEKRAQLLSGKESAYYQVLNEVLSDYGYIALPRVHLAGFLSVASNAKNLLAYSERINEQSADLLVCSRTDLTPVLVIGWESDNDSKRKQLAGRFARRAVEAAGIPFVAVKLGSPPHPEDLRRMLRNHGLAV